MSPSSLDLIISGSVLTFTPDLPKTLDKLPGATPVNNEEAMGSVLGNELINCTTKHLL